MMRCTRLLIVFFVISARFSPVLAATISGFVEDKNSGERLIGANVFDPNLNIGTSTNTYGFFSLTVNTAVLDSISLVVSYIGYDVWRARVSLANDVQLHIQLNPRPILADSVTVVAERLSNITESTEMSVVKIPVRQLTLMPALLGEVDIIKSLQLLPGVQSGSEGASGLYIRGGGPDQNLILLDGAPVYNASHLFGFFSVFNSDAVKNIQLTKGGFPARFGGRLSSVVEVNLKEGNNQEMRGQFSIGLISSRFTLEGPLKKNKSSFILSGRRTYLDLLVKPFLPENEKAGYYSHDINAKFNHIFSPKHRLYLSIYTGLDKFYSDLDYTYSSSHGELDWGNITSTARWNWLHGKKLFSNTMLLYSRYRFEVWSENEELNQNGSKEKYLLKHFSGIADYSIRTDFDFVPSPFHYIRFGVAANYRTFNPGAIQFKAEGGDNPVDNLILPSQQQEAFEINAYGEDDVKLNDWIKLNLGLHAVLFAVGSEEYASIQPRFSGRVLLEDWAVKASYAEMRQHIHLLTNSGIGLPTDLWLPATARVRPQLSRQFALGLSRSLLDNRVDLSLEAYYKTMDNLITYKEGASFIGIDRDWQNKVEIGSGRSYGLELFLHKKTGRASGWLGYTLSWSDRLFDNLNSGKRYPYRYDRRHDVGIVFTYRLSDGIDFSSTWVYGTGNSISLPAATFQVERPQIGSLWRWYDEASYYPQRNGVRMGAYHRLDLGFRFYTRRGDSERFWSIGLYNAYSRRNPFYYFRDEDEQGRRTIKQVSLFPLIPAVSYTRSF
jgi:hypothetical protein